jgi:hypothetical protein
MTGKIIDVVGAYTEYAKKNENDYLYNNLCKKGKKKRNK